jgi:DNA-binding transcriptional MerR regulator
MKLYYDTNQAAEKLNVNPSKIRFYEKKFNLKFKRCGRERQITEEDIEKLRVLIEERSKGKRTIKGTEELINKKLLVNKKKSVLIGKLLNIKTFLQKTLNELS